MGQVHGTPIKTNYRTNAPITKESIEFIKRYSDPTLLEIGCGSGIYAKLLRESGLRVIATDACKIIKNTLPEPTTRMANRTNNRAINNMIEQNAVNSVKKYGNKNVSLFLSFPLPNNPLPNNNNNSTRIRYDEDALHNFKGNKFFLIALYGDILVNKYNHNNANTATGSRGLHKYLAKNFTMEDKLLLKTMGCNGFIYLIYFKKKINNK
jgi:hypothetical protein